MVTLANMTPLERRAEFVKAATLHGTTLAGAAASLGVTWTHLLACINGERTPSAELRQRVAEYVRMSPHRFWGPLPASAA